MMMTVAMRNVWTNQGRKLRDEITNEDLRERYNIQDISNYIHQRIDNNRLAKQAKQVRPIEEVEGMLDDKIQASERRKRTCARYICEQC